MISTLLELTTEISFDEWGGGEYYDIDSLNVGRYLGRAFSQPEGLFILGYRFFLLNRQSIRNYIPDVILRNTLSVDIIAILFSTSECCG